MDVRTLIRDMEAAIKSLEEAGRTEIQVKDFKAYLDEIKNIVEELKEKDALQTQRDLAYYNAKHTSRIEYYKARTKRISDGFHAVITIGQGALKSGALINGGACVALLAFIGNIITKDASMISGLSTALLIFGFGVFCAAASTGTTYLAQVDYEKKKMKRATLINKCTIVIVTLSYLAFLCGGLISYLTIQGKMSNGTVSSISEQSPNLSSHAGEFFPKVGIKGAAERR